MKRNPNKAELFKRTFEAKEHRQGSTMRQLKNLETLTSEFYTSKKFMVVLDYDATTKYFEESTIKLFRTKKEAQEFMALPENLPENWNELMPKVASLISKYKESTGDLDDNDLKDGVDELLDILIKALIEPDHQMIIEAYEVTEAKFTKAMDKIQARDRLVATWLGAEKLLLEGKDERCLQEKDHFLEDYNKLEDDDKKSIDEQIHLSGG